MDRYLCQLCYTIVTCGERHPCFFYKNDDSVYSLPDPDDKGNTRLDEAIENLPVNLKDNFGKLFSEAQQNDTAESEKLSTLLAEKNSIHRPQGDIRGASRRKSRPKKIYKQNDGIGNGSNSFHVESSAKCRTSHDESDWNVFKNGKPRFSANPKSNAKQAHTNSQNISEASILLHSVAFPQASEEISEILTGDLRHLTDVPISPKMTSQVRNRSGHSTANVKELLSSIGDTNAIAGPSGISMQVQRDPEKRKFSCDLCDKEFDFKSQFENHYRRHTGEKPFVCYVCKKGFTHKGNLDQHYKTHTDDKPFVCDICNKGFIRKGDLVRHYRTHTDEKPFVCDVCKKGFTQNGDLVRHYRTHTDEKPFVCDVCKKGFTQKGTLDTHYRTHTGEKIFVCDICKRRFAWKYQLVTHYQTHRDGKP
ncbi:Histone-lysine N-methyltransferase PRDM9 [Araneus ventricosus]|uniref:Histone-lysine N-methyltransferase PRDM9 n=1 Tax=Araneus ventricosus TaxID=182803 RepID=A0A4Y2GAR1_ARAVE|nr:Histone-lysine N-methyltransferase PRDM9 [Araneus ventricosus]